MGTFLQQVINGLTIGAIYSLIALGYNLIYGIANVLSFAHGALVMVGSYSMLSALIYLGFSYPLAIFCGLGSAVVVGYFVERLTIRPVIARGGTWGVIISTIGAALFIQFTVRRFTRGRPEPFPVPFEPFYVDLPWGARVSSMQLALMASGLILLALLWVIIYRTKLGTAIRAIAQSPDISSCLGMNRMRIQFYTFTIASLIAGASGILYSVYYGATYVFMGLTLGLKGLVVMKVAGIGHLPGCVATGIMLGLIEVMVVGYGDSTYRDFVGYSWLILVFMIKPQGMFGARGRATFEIGASAAVRPMN